MGGTGRVDVWLTGGRTPLCGAVARRGPGPRCVGWLVRLRLRPCGRVSGVAPPRPKQVQDCCGCSLPLLYTR